MKNRIYTAAALSLLASGAFAGQLEDQIIVSADVTEACQSITATDASFGSAGAADVTDDTTATITVTCDNGTNYDVSIDYGIAPVGGTQRQVTSTGGEFMLYDVFQPGDFVTPWGLLADGDAVAGTGNGAAQTLTPNFRLQRTSGSGAGHYEDLLTVYLDF